MSTVFDIAGPLPTGVTVLEASAGTGKTFAITALVTRYIVESGHTADQVLMVTFAKGAAAEMRERLRARLRDAISALEGSAPPTDAWLTPIYIDEPATRAERLARAKDAVANLDRATITTIHGFCHQALRRLGTHAGDAALADEVNAGNPILVSRFVRDELLAELARNLFAFGDLDPSTIEKEVLKVLKTLFNNSSVIAAPTDQSGKDDHAYKLAQLAMDLRKRIVTARRESKALSFDDMVEILREVLDSGDSGNAVRDQLRGQYKLVLIDEFQDTDMSQWEIFSQVFTPQADDSDRVLIMVGDPKQAIYRFRGADVSAYVNAVNASGITRHDMTVNWRSDSDLIAALNTLFEGADFGQQKIPYVPVSARPNAPARALQIKGINPKPLELRYITKADAGDADADGVRAAIAVDLANYVHSLIGNAEIVSSDGTSRRVRARDIAILLRANNDSRYFRNELRALGIPAVESRVGGVNESDAFDQVQVFMNVLNAVSDARRVRSLVFTWFSDLELKDLVDGAKIEALQLQCAKWSDDLARKGVSYMYEQVRAESSLMRQIAGSEAPTRHLTDIEHVFELLSAATNGRPVAPAVALHHLEQIRDEDSQSDTLLRRTETDADAVQITSMHASKGLEYPIVLLPVPKGISTETPYVYTLDGVRYVDGANKVPWSRDEHGDRDARRDLAKAEDLDDLRRLIYVALTRARHQLTVWWASTGRAQQGALGTVLFKESSNLTDKNFTDEVVHSALNGWVEAGKGNIGLTKLNFAAQLADVTTQNPVVQTPITAANIAAVKPNDFDWARWSFSSITKDQHSAREESPKGGSDEEHDEELQIVAAPVGALGGFAGSADFGTYLHEVMERVDFTVVDLQGEVAGVVNALGTPSFIEGGEESFVQGIVDAIVTPLGGLGGNALSHIARKDRLAELRFDMSLGRDARTKLATLAELAASDPGSPFADYFRTQANDWDDRRVAGFLTGSIDALFRLDIDGQQKFVVVDYKSNNLARFNTAQPYGYESMRAAMISSGYPLQALIYSVATHRYLSARMSGYDPAVHLGGCGYLFMRGMIGANTPVRNGVTDGVFVWRPSVDLVVGADQVLGGGNA